MQLSFKAFKTGLKVTIKICNILFKSLIFILLDMLSSMNAILEFHNVSGKIQLIFYIPMNILKDSFDTL